ncbi:pyrroloquinoline quinone biosynthesis peptide chaperone PqqD [Roseibium algae]|uniref:Pyrroloquinoline quinone biosynthesis peptide chaperone PqqD n=1 Tax=Roseibium algae TaxID=3123038 RepID=A0ABU8TNP7_9HYPH
MMNHGRSRLQVTKDSCPFLPPHVHLRFDDLRSKWVVLAPEKVLWPDDISVDILNLCNGQATVTEIVDGLAKDYDAPQDQIRPDVLGFLQEWCDKLLIHCEVRQ